MKVKISIGGSGGSLATPFFPLENLEALVAGEIKALREVEIKHNPRMIALIGKDEVEERKVSIHISYYDQNSVSYRVEDYGRWTHGLILLGSADLSSNDLKSNRGQVQEVLGHGQSQEPL